MLALVVWQSQTGLSAPGFYMKCVSIKKLLAINLSAQENLY
jgi:hypothetical protein